jgi:hypothetical protein
MNTEQIKDTIRTINKMTYAETVNNQNRITAAALWEIALQLSLLIQMLSSMRDAERPQ